MNLTRKWISILHSGPNMPKSQPRGESPKFTYHVEGGYIGISKKEIFFKSVEGNF